MNTRYTQTAIQRQMRYAKQQHDPLLTLVSAVKNERTMVAIGIEIAEYHKATNYAGYADPDEVRKDDLDYIIDHRLALICAAQRLNDLQAENFTNWKDWNDTRESAIAATRP